MARICDFCEEREPEYECKDCYFEFCHFCVTRNNTEEEDIEGLKMCPECDCKDFKYI